MSKSHNDRRNRPDNYGVLRASKEAYKRHGRRRITINQDDLLMEYVEIQRERMNKVLKELFR